MRCSTCMSELQPRGSDFICPKCETLLEGEMLDIPEGYVEPDIDPDTGRLARLGRGFAIGLGLVSIFGLGGVGGWLLRSEVASLDELSPKVLAGLVTGQPVEAPADAAAVAIESNRIDAARFVTLGSDLSEGAGLVAIGADAGDYRRIEFSENGEVRFRETLTGLPDGQLVAATRAPERGLILALLKGTQLTLLARGKDGGESWSRQIELANEGAPGIALEQFGESGFLIASIGDPATPTAHFISKSGEIEWTRRLPDLGSDPVRLAISPFSEIVMLARSGGDPLLYKLLSFTEAGIPGMSAEFRLREDQAILDMAIDRLGRVHVLISGGPPELLVADALGRNTDRTPLAPLITLDPDAACSLMTKTGRLHVFCGTDDGFTETVFDSTESPPALMARTSRDVRRPVLTLDTGKAVTALVPSSEARGYEIVSLPLSPDPDLNAASQDTPPDLPD